eukprot:m.272979 g.272979  ORF g.272979 m.272979 type:complete len:342 (+) comp54812_c0_seq1:710-1735(+)
MEDAAASFGLKNLRSLTQFGINANTQFEGETAQGKRAFARITLIERRSQASVECEARWLAALSAQGLTVARPLPSTAGPFTQPLQFHDQEAVMMVTEGVPGRSARRPDLTDVRFLQSWASLIAAMHLDAISSPLARDIPRLRWDEDPIHLTALEDSAENTSHLRDCFRSCLSRMREFPSSEQLFGLIHADAQVSNFFVVEPSEEHKGLETWLIDFDDACFHWYATDLAVAIAQLRKASVTSPDFFQHHSCAELEASFLDAYFLNRFGFTKAELQVEASDATSPQQIAKDTLALLEVLIPYRMSLIMCWASAENARKPTQEREQFIQASLPVYSRLIRDCGY